MERIVRNVILGAGIAGLAAAYDLDERDTVVFEALPYSGGLCHSFRIGDFSFDTAVHLSFASDPEVRKVFDQTPYHTHFPKPYNYYNGLWLKHPVINNLAHLPVEEKVSCIRDLIKRESSRAIHTYEDWLLASYGDSLFGKFYEVYTRKYWTVPPADMSCSWIGIRLPEVDLDKVLTGAFEESTGVDYYAAEMRYPKHGGFESFLGALKNKARIELNKEVVRVDLSEKRVTFADGGSVHYENLINTTYLPAFIQLCDNVPREVLTASKRLIASAVSLVSVGFNDPNAAKYLWAYVYDEDIWAARIHSPSIKSPANAPDGCSSLQFEIYHHPDTIPSKDRIVENVRYSIQKMGIADEKDILFMDYRFVPYGNVIFYTGMETDRDAVINYLKGQGIYLAGRFGEWDYLWTDQSFLSGKKAALSLKDHLSN